MRHLFDQYNHPENRLTHALVSSLANDERLLRDFIRWAVKDKFSLKEKLYVVEQSVPGESEVNEDIAGKRGLPDAWIYNDKDWALLIESKIAAKLKLGQLRRHMYTANKHGFTKPKILTIEVTKRKDRLLPDIYSKTWQEIYEWGRKYLNKSQWADLFTSYFEVAEAKMVEEEYLKEGALTKFTGIPFSSEHPYSYFEAKRLLGLVINELRNKKKLIRELKIDPHLPRRAAITGQQSSHVWDYLRVRESKKEKSFTKYPHLTIGIHAEFVNIAITIPHRVKTEIRNRLFKTEYSKFIKAFSIVLSSSKRILALDGAVKPYASLVQRHYLSQRSLPIHDARLVFDLRTAFKHKSKVPEKYQPIWLKTTYDAMRNKRSNLQFQVGFEISYKDSITIGTPKAINLFEESLFALKPILDFILDR